MTYLFLSALILSSFCTPSAFATDLLSSLPYEIFLHISSFQNSEEQRELSLVNRGFRNILVHENHGKRPNLTGRTLSKAHLQAVFAPGAFYANSLEVNLSRSTFPAQSLTDLPAHLEYLNLSYSVIQGDPTPFMNRFPQLKTLILSNTRYLESAWKVHGPYGRLMTLEIPDDFLEHLPESLEVLELGGNSDLTVTKMSWINSSRLPHLKYLGLSDMGKSWFRKITAEVIQGLPKTLEHLNLSGSVSSPDSLSPLTAENFPKLKFLDISKLPHFRTNILHQLPITLEWLDLTGSDFLATSGELTLLSRFKNLKGLSLNHVKGVTPPVIDELLKLRGLEILDLHGLGNILTGFDIARLEHLPRLTRHDFSTSTYPSAPTASWVQAYGPNRTYWTDWAHEKALNDLTLQREADKRREWSDVMGFL